MVQYLLEINCDITENSLGQTPLALAQEEEHKELYSLFKEELPPPILAIQNDDIQGIVKYLDNGNVNFTYQHQKTLLHHAAEKGRLQMVQILIQKSCLLSPVDEMNYTPLYYAALNQQYDVFKLLVDQGAKLFPDSTSVIEDWFYSAEQGNEGMIKYLLEQNVDIDSSRDDKTAFLLALNNGNVSCAKTLLEKNCNITLHLSGSNLLHYVSSAKHPESLQFVLNLNMFDINGLDDYGMNALHYASQYGKVNNVHLLLDAKCDIDMRSQSEMVPISYAVSYQQIEVTKALIERGCNKYLNVNGRSLIVLAVLNKSLPILQLLGQDFKMNVNDVDLNGDTCLLIAVETLQYDVIKYLLERGANKEIQNPAGETPLTRCQKKLNSAVALQKHYATLKAPSHSMNHTKKEQDNVVAKLKSIYLLLKTEIDLSL
eukprot:TRINITY_DN13531_c0_g7_i1.p1 TRINITY_DN13531_c0_g7~~TRINITY_DN13531_c0_g7_i1.p1  ORF type:complete len:496 (+),score=111.28 TRINITY_DN13531_c0_g7_i1:202-1488(+)